MQIPYSIPGLGPSPLDASGNPVKRATARKSTQQPQQAARQQQQQQQFVDSRLIPAREYQGKCSALDPPRVDSLAFAKHICSPDCIREHKYQ